jgi:hypothetical protein
MKPVDLVFVDGAIAPATKDNRKDADVTLRVDPRRMTDNAAFAKLAEALKHFTTQTQWPPATGAE